jgi:DNA-binding protein Alba
MSSETKTTVTQNQGTPEKSDNKIQVSSSKQSLSFYIHLSKKFLTNQDEIELSGLGSAINTVVSVAEIIKNSKLADITHIQTSTVEVKNEEGTLTPKAKIQVWLKKSKDFDAIIEKQKQEVEEKKKQKQFQSQPKSGKSASKDSKSPATPKQDK